jgi:hypothetical protein
MAEVEERITKSWSKKKKIGNSYSGQKSFTLAFAELEFEVSYLS